MASITHHRNKETGAVYVYSVESYWDKEKKAPRNRQTCLGRLDPETGEVIPSKRKRKVAERAAAANALRELRSAMDSPGRADAECGGIIAEESE